MLNMQTAAGIEGCVATPCTGYAVQKYLQLLHNRVQTRVEAQSQIELMAAKLSRHYEPPRKTWFLYAFPNILETERALGLVKMEEDDKMYKYELTPEGVTFLASRHSTAKRYP
jgi:hypothetical protein